MNINPKFIDVSGAEMVLLTKAEYEILIEAFNEAEEDAIDAAIYRERKAALERGDDSVLPADVSAFMLKGDSLLRAVRKWRDYTQMYLAHKSGVGQSYISDIEAGRRTGTVETIMVLAKALDVPAVWLLPRSQD